MSPIDFDLLDLENDSEYSRQINRVLKNTSHTESIEKTVLKASESIKSGVRSFVIYGEPQSGKTEMMICLTAKLLDDGFKNIVILVNDNVELQNQNLERFRKSGLSPSPKSLQELKNSEALKNTFNTVIFCKKNAKDLKVLNDRLRNIKRRVVIDDEADFATPNSKINSADQSKINKLVDDLLDTDQTSVYIGVTATPARLDLNNLFENSKSDWVYFKPYPEYSGHDTFFPAIDKEDLAFNLVTLPDEGDKPEFLQKALVRFLVNVAHLNIFTPKDEKNYCMLVHTSGLRGEHAVDKEVVEKFFAEIEDKSHKNFAKRYEQIHKDASERYKVDPDEIVKYVFKNRQRYAIRLVNSDNDRTDDIKGATNPETPFTVAIGGNIVSRGVTFNNLLTMFFTRTVKHKIQQDTYIQRARMFGNRTGYLDHFELHIPETLYLDWHQAFSLHGLSMASIETKKPVWLEDRRIRAVSSSSIDKSSLSIDRGEISFEKFDLNDELLTLTSASKKGYAHFQKVIDQLPQDYLSDHIYRFVESTRPFDEDSIVLHVTREIKGSEAIDEENISRARGMYGGQDYERDAFPKAVHHFKIFMNNKGVGRVIYNYRATDKSITFLKVRRNKI